jgi:hypothetical protein
MEFQVPQFIEVEDKLFGPLTWRQFVYLVGGAGFCFILYHFLPIFLAILLMLPVAGLTAALAFYKMNGKSFVQIAQAALGYQFSEKLYLWRKSDKPAISSVSEAPSKGDLYIPKLSDSKLKDLAWSLDIKESVYSDKNQR